MQSKKNHQTLFNPWLTAFEVPRVLHEMSLLAPSHFLLKRLPKGDGHPVIVIPGFSANNATTFILRHYLERWGYAVEPWSVGTNINPLDIDNFDDIAVFKEKAVQTVCRRLETIHQQTGKKVSLIGWSLGGVFSRAIASEAQAHVRQVISLGSPFCDPRSVIVYPLLEKFKKQAMSEDHMQAWYAMCNAPLGEVSISQIYSDTDGFVPAADVQHFNHHLQEMIHVCSSHMGFAVNPAVLYVIAKRLAAHEQPWSALRAQHLWQKVVFSVQSSPLTSQSTACN